MGNIVWNCQASVFRFKFEREVTDRTHTCATSTVQIRTRLAASHPLILFVLWQRMIQQAVQAVFTIGIALVPGTLILLKRIARLKSGMCALRHKVVEEQKLAKCAAREGDRHIEACRQFREQALVLLQVISFSSKPCCASLWNCLRDSSNAFQRIEQIPFFQVTLLDPAGAGAASEHCRGRQGQRRKGRDRKYGSQDEPEAVKEGMLSPQEGD